GEITATLRGGIPSADDWCRVVPGHPSKHGANTEPGRSRPIRRRSSPPPGRALPAVRNAGPQVASAVDTIRNLAWVGNAAGRREMDLPYNLPCTSDVPAGRPVVPARPVTPVPHG